VFDCNPKLAAPPLGKFDHTRHAKIVSSLASHIIRRKNCGTNFFRRTVGKLSRK
jgi:hypothetical protein